MRTFWLGLAVNGLFVACSAVPQASGSVPPSIPGPGPAVNRQGESTTGTTDVLADIDAFLTSHHVRIQRGASSSADLTKPAKFQVLDPAGDEASVAVDIGVSWDPAGLESDRSGFLDATARLGLAAEAHRNTQFKKEQETYRGGLTGAVFFGDSTSSSGQYFFPFSATYKSDEIKDIEGALGKLEMLPLLPHLHIGIASREPIDDLGLSILWQPRVGLAYEYADPAATGAQSGEVSRLTAGIDVDMRLFRSLLGDRLSLAAGFQYWHIIAESNMPPATRTDDSIMSVALSYLLNKSENVGVSLEYQSGANPETGLEDQEWLQLTLTLQFGNAKQP